MIADITSKAPDRARELQKLLDDAATSQPAKVPPRAPAAQGHVEKQAPSFGSGSGGGFGSSNGGGFGSGGGSNDTNGGFGSSGGFGAR